MKALLWRCFFHVHFWEVLHEINGKRSIGGTLVDLPIFLDN